MKKNWVVLFFVFVVSAGLAFAQDTKIGIENGGADEMIEHAGHGMAMDAEEGTPIEVGNTICPLSGRELNLDDPKDFTTLEVEGYVFNVCHMKKAEYDKSPVEFTEKISAAIMDVESDAMLIDETPMEEEAPEATK